LLLLRWLLCALLHACGVVVAWCVKAVAEQNQTNKNRRGNELPIHHTNQNTMR